MSVNEERSWDSRRHHPTLRGRICGGRIRHEFATRDDGPIGHRKRHESANGLRSARKTQPCADTPVAIIGRYEKSVGIIDQYEFLAQSGCDPKITTETHVWPNKMLVRLGPEADMPKPPDDTPKFSQTDLAEKLSLVRKTTELGFIKNHDSRKEEDYRKSMCQTIGLLPMAGL